MIIEIDVTKSSNCIPIISVRMQSNYHSKQDQQRGDVKRKCWIDSYLFLLFYSRVGIEMKNRYLIDSTVVADVIQPLLTVDISKVNKNVYSETKILAYL